MDVLNFLLKNLLPIMLTAIITFFLSEPVRFYYGYFIHIARNARRLSEQMKYLQGKMEDLPHGGNEAKVWVSEMKSLKKEVDSFEGDYKIWERHGFFSRLILRCGIAMRAGELLERADLLAKVNVDAERPPPPPPVQERGAPDCVLGLELILEEALDYIQWKSQPTPPPLVPECNASEPIHGLMSFLGKALSYLKWGLRAQHLPQPNHGLESPPPPSQLDVAVPGPRVIGIFGVGGVGKTTLLKQINNFFALRPAGNVFDHVLLATVSKDVNLEKLQEDVAWGLDLRFPGNQNLSLQQRAEVIFNYMKDTSFLLLLDDLWAHLDLEKLGIPNPQEGGCQLQRTVVFTTRFQNVCDSMQAMDAKKQRIKVAFLSKAHAWQLFRKMLGDKFNDSDSEIYKLAMSIAEECHGLPLALKVIGAAMSSRKCLDDWEDALESLKKSQPISGMEKDVFAVLKHSYDNLNDEKMRKCFLCCVLWPEDSNIQKNKLIKCWMGLGLLDGLRVDDRYRAGRKNIQILKDACLLEAGDDENRQVKMHDMIRDMALWIASDEHKWMVRVKVHLIKASINVEQQATVGCISLMGSSLKNISLFERDQEVLPKLSTLILHKANYPPKIITNISFSCMSNLTYLDLSHNMFSPRHSTQALTTISCLQELPPEICDLMELQYLNLSYKLIVKSLPQEFGQLKKLRYLILRETTFLENVTPKVMPRAMEMLDLYECSLNWEVEGETIFKGLKKLQVLDGITVQSTSQLWLLSKLSHVQIWSINIKKADGLASLDIKQSFMGDHLRNHLKNLFILQLNDLTELKVDFGEKSNPGMAWRLQRLEFLRLHRLPRLEKIIWRGVEPREFLPRLRMLHIFDCDQLKNVSWVLQLRCLEDLFIESCRGMTTLIDGNEIGEGAANLAFPHLKKLDLELLPKLEDVFNEGLAFPSLETIIVVHCPKLRRLPFLSPMANSRMREIKSSQEWWDGLQWENDSIRTSLHTHFVHIQSRSWAI